MHTDPKRPAALLCALALSAAFPAAAQEWPSRPIRMMVGFGPGGGTDIIARMVAQPLAEILGQPIVVENKPGAGGTLAANTVARAAPDGHTIFVMNNGHAVSAAVYQKLPFDSVKDFAPVSTLCAQPLVVVAGKNFPAQDLGGLVARAKAQPGKLNYASVGIGSTQHFAAELLRQLTDIDIVHVPYKGTPNAVAAVMSGEVELLVEVASPLLGQIRAGELKPLAVTSPKRYDGLPDVPTAVESGVAGYDVTTWYGLAFPAGTPAPIVEKMNQAVRKALAQDAVRKQAMAAACLPEASSPDALGRHVSAEIERWKGVMQKAGIAQQ
ncbi:Bug family tripartite tricarboxylate transporter substrate binding protein [Pigmentiphaga humi]|nr:tripartite tricarboxylate transporter substrate binding protein [Pigmentiphaga humi]